MIAAALLLAVVQPPNLPDLPPVVFASESEEERLTALGYSPAAVKIIHEAPALAGSVVDDELLELLRLRDEAAKGTVPAAQFQQSEEAYNRKRALERARRDDAILGQLKLEDRLLYLNQMRWLAPPPPLLGPAPPAVKYMPEQVFQKERLARAAGDDSQLRRLSGVDRLDFLIRLRSTPR